MRKIRLVAADVDGTLLNSRKELTGPVEAAIRRIRSEGVLFTIVTGRDIRGLRKLSHLLDEGIPVVTCNGAELRRAGSGELLQRSWLSETAALEVIRRGLELGLAVIVWSHGELFIGQPGPASSGYSEMYGIREKPLPDQKALAARGVTKVIWAGEEERIRDLEELYAKTPIADSACCTSDPRYLEFMDGRVSKGTGLADAAAVLGIPREAVAAVGDGHNDLPMLRWAGFSIAMGNAADEVKEAANMVTGSCDEDGLAQALDLLFPMEG